MEFREPKILEISCCWRVKFHFREYSKILQGLDMQPARVIREFDERLGLTPFFLLFFKTKFVFKRFVAQWVNGRSFTNSMFHVITFMKFRISERYPSAKKATQKEWEKNKKRDKFRGPRGVGAPSLLPQISWHYHSLSSLSIFNVHNLFRFHLGFPLPGGSPANSI